MLRSRLQSTSPGPRVLANPEVNGMDESSLSMRLSCDRCRIQKLKCSVPTGSDTCQRCTRARVSCVFGRRSHSKRRYRQNSQTQKCLSNPAVQEDCVTAATNGPPTPPASTASGTGSAMVASHIESDHAPQTATEIDQAFGDPSDTWGTSAMGHLSLTPDMSEYLSNLSGYNWLSNGYPMYDGNTTDFGIPDASPWPPLATLATSSSDLPESVIVDSDDTTSSVRNNDAVLTSQHLTYLISEIQQQLQKLEEGPWHTDNTVSLDDYPVGTILELSQQFSTVAGPILSNAVSLNGNTKEAEYQDENEGVNTGATVDTPTMLLVMCGYMWLVRIYSVVLGHFQEHLNNMPTSQYISGMSGRGGLGPSVAGPSSVAPGTSTGAALRLGQLPCVDADLRLHRIYMAVRMLLDVLQDIDGQLGGGAVIACNMAVGLLLNSSRQQGSSSHSLGKKAMMVKELLRERIGF
ncbi:unnamed protein product [Penicillium glandicola]